MSIHWQRYVLLAVVALLVFFLLMPIIGLITIVFTLIGIGAIVGALVMWARSRRP